MTTKTTVGRVYAITSPNGCTVTDENGLVIATVEAGQQLSVVATGAQMTVDDESAAVTLVFKYAPTKLQALGLFGGGETLPSGYLPALFLEKTDGTRAEHRTDASLGAFIYLGEFDTTNAESICFKTERTVLNRNSCGEGYIARGYTVTKADNFGYIVWSSGLHSRIGIGSAGGAYDVNSFNTIELRYENNIGYITINGVTASHETANRPNLKQFGVFTSLNDPDSTIEQGCWASPGKIKYSQLSIDNKMRADLRPCISVTGVPSMYDRVTKQPFYNSGRGSFIVGMTAAQAVQLANLPTGGGELTVSLPQSILNDAGEITDAAVNAALNKAADNGWTITLQYYTES